MNNPSQDRGALSLLLRLTMLQARQRVKGSLPEQGYSLAVALIAAFVLLLGVAALASRGQLGFIGQVFQVQNRQARDVAEAAIAEFGDTLNREENRYLLIANNSGSDWNNVINRNPCLAFDDNQDPISGRDPNVPSTLPAIGAGVVGRFSQGTGFRNLRGNDTTRRFRVERIEYLNPQRTGPIDRQQLINADDRGLIRVTMIGRVDLGNGRVSFARVAREFEVVPKCCNQSYGANDARNWGRDRQACEVTGVSQFRVSLSGGSVSGKGGAITVIDTDGDPVRQAVCWNGSDGSDPNNVLTSGVSPNPNCNPPPTISSKGGGVSFSPSKFDYSPPAYASSAPADYLSQVTAKEQPQSALNILSSATLSMPEQNKDYYIYFDDTKSNLRVCRTTATGIDTTNCFAFPNDSNGNPVCYTRIAQGSGPNAPYNEVNCRLRNIVSGNQIIYVDTSKARINFFFDDTSLTSSTEIMGGGGNSTFRRVHCRWGASNYYSTTYDSTTRCNQDLVWLNTTTGNDYQQLCTTSTGKSCGLTDSGGTLYNKTYFDVSELFNIYSSSKGSFNLNGTASTIGFNLYAPFSNVTIKGGGTADPNMMGRLWVNGFAVNGSVSLNVPSGGPSGFEDALDGALWDFRARSFTQASGF